MQVRRGRIGERVQVEDEVGAGEPMESGSPTRAFRSVDLPTFGSPARATMPKRGMGNLTVPGTRTHETPPRRTGVGFQWKGWRRSTLPPTSVGSTIDAGG